MTPIWVTVPAHRPALDHLKALLDQLGDLAQRTVVVTNGDDPIRDDEIFPAVTFEDNAPGVADDPVNISRWWNLGLDWIDDASPEPHHVLVLNADTRITPQGVAQLSYSLERSSAVMVGPHRSPGEYMETRPGPLGLRLRIPGFCFMLDSKAGLRADERFRWWCGDDDLEWRARQSGGTLLVGAVQFAHLGDGTPRGELRKLAEDDLWRFQEKWGVRPW